MESFDSHDRASQCDVSLGVTCTSMIFIGMGSRRRLNGIVR